MMVKMVTGSEALAKRLAAIPDDVLNALRPALARSVADCQSAFKTDPG